MSKDLELNFLLRVVDDDPRTLDAVTFMLKCEGYEVAPYLSPADFFSNDMPSVPGCVISDIKMEPMNGIEFYKEAMARRYTHPFIFLTAFADIELAVNSMKDGVIDYLVKPVVAEKLFLSVARAIRIDSLQYVGIENKRECSKRWDRLTSREKQIMELVASGKTSVQISVILAISERTVQTHRSSALQKLELTSPADVGILISHLKE